MILHYPGVRFNYYLPHFPIQTMVIYFNKTSAKVINYPDSSNFHLYAPPYDINPKHISIIKKQMYKEIVVANQV